MNKRVMLGVAVAILIIAYVFYPRPSHAAVPHNKPVYVAPVTVVAPAANFGGSYVGVDFNALNIDNVEANTKTKYDFGYAGRVGYGVQTYDGYYIGGEVTDGTNSGVTRNPSVKDKTNNDLAVDARAGKIFSDTLVYGKVGYALTNVTESNLSDGAVNSANFNGLRFGGGVERFLADKITGRAEAVYTNYASRTVDNNQVDPSNVAIKVGLSYKLD